ncbi:MAG: single-stranded DNA-binding protein [Candidatus Nealsonbacteria bacterium]|nr:single-stranded DNA-binding protein [Candidatus Nealsonbacteria bacterium]
MNFNKVILIGRLTRDPENRALPSGQSLTSFGMATDRFFTDKNGQKQQQVEFHNIVLFGKLADIAVQYLNKGSLVLIEGRLQTRTWQDSSGNKRTRTEIVAERLQLGPKSSGKITPEAPPQEGTEETKKEEIPIIEEDEIDIKDIPF